MTKNAAIRAMVLASVGWASLGFLGGCSETSTPAGGTIKEDPQKALDRQKLIEDQYKNKGSTPGK